MAELTIVASTTASGANLGPLTTTYTPALPCLSSTRIESGYWEMGPSRGASECFPSTYNTNGFYSPGLICPSGYATSGIETFTSGTVTEMHARCCPRGYSLLTTSSLSCRQEYSTSIYVSGISEYYWSTRSVWADAVFMRFQLTDIISTAPETSMLSTDALTAATSVGTEDRKPGGLSTGAKVGIGLGIPLFLVLCGLGFGWWLIWRRRRRATPTGPVTEVSNDVPEQYPGPTSGSWQQGYPASSNESGKPASGLPTSERGTNDLPEWVNRASR